MSNEEIKPDLSHDHSLAHSLTHSHIKVIQNIVLTSLENRGDIIQFYNQVWVLSQACAGEQRVVVHLLPSFLIAK